MTVIPPFNMLNGKRFLVSLNNFVTELYFETDANLTFKIIEGAGLIDNGYQETVSVKGIALRPDIYFLWWKEKSGATVSHVENHSSKVLHSIITMPDGQFFHFIGSIQPVEEMKIKKTEQPALSKDLTGKKIESDYGEYKVVLHFNSPEELHVTATNGIALKHKDEKVKPSIYKVDANVYLVTYRESNDVIIAEVLDLESKRVYSNITKPDNSFSTIEGGVEELK